MKRKKKPSAPLPQLCLFSDQEMQSMVEDPAEEKAAGPLPADPDWLQWQLMIGVELTGKAGRQHRKMLTAKKKQTPKLTDQQITNLAIADCLRSNGDPVTDDIIEAINYLLP